VYNLLVNKSSSKKSACEEGDSAIIAECRTYRSTNDRNKQYEK